MPFASATIVHHMAALDEPVGPPNSLAAVRACLDAAADVIEVDISALEDQDFLLVHDDDLANETSGSGPVRRCRADRARELRVRHNGGETAHPVALLSDVVALVLAHPATTQLQLDLKSVDPDLPDDVVDGLVQLIDPLGSRVIVSSGADWHLRRLRKIAPRLRLGFDPMWLIDWEPDAAPRDPSSFPRRRGAYGYFDDHLLATERRTTPARYLQQRCEGMLGLVPGVDTLYLDHELLAQSLNDGFNWAEALHAAGIRLDAWTLDVTNPRARAHAVRLVEAGVDAFTSNTPLGMRALLAQAASLA